MTINLSDVVGITLNGSSVVKIEDTLGNILWQAGPAPDPSTEYFYVKNLTSSANTLSIKKNDSSAPTITVYYSTDKTTWTSMGDTDTTAITYSIPANSKVYLKATTDRWGGESGNTIYTSITCSNNFGIGGNIMSLLYGDNFSGQTSFPSSSTYNFTCLFWGSSKLKNIDNLVLPATTLTEGCYENIFTSCEGLTSIPSDLLPATTLAERCYQYMFYNCTGLTSVPSDLLHATTLATSCYANMFSGCTGLTSIPENLLPATTLADSCYHAMFNICTGLTTIPSNLLPATTLASGCYRAMFSGTGLTTIPSNLLHSTTLADQCYQSMFSNCTGLTSIPENLLPATTLTSFCYDSMFYICTGLTTIPSNLLHSTTLASYCYRSMFKGCTGLTSIPEDLLPATTLASYCYNSMFYGCTSLTKAPDLLAYTGTSYCYSIMFSGCTSLTSARVYLNNADDTTLNPTNGMFTNISTTGILYKPIFLDHTNEWPWSRSSTSSTATGEYPYRWTIQAEIT